MVGRRSFPIGKVTFQGRTVKLSGGKQIKPQTSLDTVYKYNLNWAFMFEKNTFNIKDHIKTYGIYVYIFIYIYSPIIIYLYYIYMCVLNMFLSSSYQH